MKTQSMNCVLIHPQFDSTKIAIIPYLKTNRKADRGITNIELTLEEIEVLDTILTKYISAYNLQEAKRIDELNENSIDVFTNKKELLINLNNYYRQYIATENSKGEKEVWINCFCEYYENWKSTIVHVDDGWLCSFNLTIILNTGGVKNFMLGGR